LEGTRPPRANTKPMAATSDIFKHRGGSRDRNARGDRESKLASDPVVTRQSFLAADVADAEFLDELAGRIAVRLAACLAGLDSERTEALIDASEVARRTGRSRWWVYEHTGELGAVRLGSGSRPRLAFWPSRVDEYLQAAAELRQPMPVPVRARPQRRRSTGRTSTGVELLPIRGHDA
jgi:predicted DNA-binding transcriptional regulator AlpA